MMPKAKRARLDSAVEPYCLQSPDSSSSPESPEAKAPTTKTKLQVCQQDKEEAEKLTKPDASYIQLIAMAILEAPGQKIHLQDIYESLKRKFPYFQVAKPSWRNNVRHNLSLHDCFCKLERCESGKGHYWSIHPANLQDFLKGDFRRSKIRSKPSRPAATTVQLNLPNTPQEHTVFKQATVFAPLNYSPAATNFIISPTPERPLVPSPSSPHVFFIPVPLIQSYPLPPSSGKQERGSSATTLAASLLKSTATTASPLDTNTPKAPNTHQHKKQVLNFSVKSLLSTRL